VLAWHIREGHYGDVQLDGLSLIAVAAFEGNIWDGETKADLGLFIDERADESQREALQMIFGGQAGGFPAEFAELIGETLGVEVAPIEYEDDGRRHRVRIGDFAEIEIEDFVPPQTSEGEVPKLTGVFHPANSTLTMAQATTSRVNAFGLEFSHEGKNGHSAPFSWAA
jgi:hypothetical protein